MRTFTKIPNDLFEYTLVLKCPCRPSLCAWRRSGYARPPWHPASPPDRGEILTYPSNSHRVPRNARSAVTTGTEVGIVRICVEGRTAPNSLYIHICHVAVAMTGLTAIFE